MRRGGFCARLAAIRPCLPTTVISSKASYSARRVGEGSRPISATSDGRTATRVTSLPGQSYLLVVYTARLRRHAAAVSAVGAARQERQPST